MRGSSNDDIVDFNSEMVSLVALTVGSASMITIDMRHIALIFFQTIDPSKHIMNHIDD
jgi:hypothetical protein